MNMKTLACLTATLAATAALADIEVQVGVTEVTSAYTNTIVAVPYTGFDSNNITVSNVVKTANLVAGDMCYAMSSTAGLYDAWELKSNAGVLYWDKTQQIQINTNGSISVTTSPSADATTLAPGSALWICRKGPRSAALSTTPFYLWGQYSGTVPKTTVKATKSGTWNLVANCGTSAITIQDLINKFDSKCKAGDQIVEATDGRAKSHYCRTASESVSTWTGNSSSTIQPGMGVWVFKKTSVEAGEDIEISW